MTRTKLHRLVFLSLFCCVWSIDVFYGLSAASLDFGRPFQIPDAHLGSADSRRAKMRRDLAGATM